MCLSPLPLKTLKEVHKRRRAAASTMTSKSLLISPKNNEARLSNAALAVALNGNNDTTDDVHKERNSLLVQS